MADSCYDNLHPSTQLEQAIAADLESALAGRGCKVVHHGGAHHSPAGKPDIEIRDSPNSRLILLEVTKSTGSGADHQFASMVDHLDSAIEAGGYKHYGMLFVSPKTSARMSAHIRDLVNSVRDRESKAGRIIPLDFGTLEMLVKKLVGAPSNLYPAANFAALFAEWERASVNDACTKLLVSQKLLPGDNALHEQLKNEVRDEAGRVAESLRNDLMQMENALRDSSITGHHANDLLIYLTFLRLYEERRQRIKGEENRFTVAGFESFCSLLPEVSKNDYPDRLFEFLLHEVSQDPELESAGLLRDAAGQPQKLHENVTDADVRTIFLPRVRQIRLLWPGDGRARRGVRDAGPPK